MHCTVQTFTSFIKEELKIGWLNYNIKISISCQTKDVKKGKRKQRCVQQDVLYDYVCDFLWFWLNPFLNSKGNSFHWGGGTPQDNEINIFLGGNYTNDM